MPSRTNTPATREEELVVDGVMYRKLGHAANQRKRSKQSPIWLYGEEYRKEKYCT